MARPNYTVRTECVASFSGQRNFVTEAFDETGRIGFLEWVLYGGVASVSYIEVAEEDRRRGVATALMDAMRLEAPRARIDYGHVVSMEGGRLVRSRKMRKNPSTGVRWSRLRPWEGVHWGAGPRIQSLFLLADGRALLSPTDHDSGLKKVTGIDHFTKAHQMAAPDRPIMLTISAHQGGRVSAGATVSYPITEQQARTLRRVEEDAGGFDPLFWTVMAGGVNSGIAAQGKGMNELLRAVTRENPMTRSFCIASFDYHKRASAYEGGTSLGAWKPRPEWGTFPTAEDAKRHLMEGLDPSLAGAPDEFIQKHYGVEVRNRRFKVAKTPGATTRRNPGKSFCAWCQRWTDDEGRPVGEPQPIDAAESHGICTECSAKVLAGNPRTFRRAARKVRGSEAGISPKPLPANQRKVRGAASPVATRDNVRQLRRLLAAGHCEVDYLDDRGVRRRGQIATLLRRLERGDRI